MKYNYLTLLSLRHIRMPFFPFIPIMEQRSSFFDEQIYMLTNLTPNFLFLCVKYMLLILFSYTLHILTKQDFVTTVYQQLIKSPCLGLLLRLAYKFRWWRNLFCSAVCFS